MNPNRNSEKINRETAAEIPPLPEPLVFSIKAAYPGPESAYPQAYPHPMYEGMRQPLTSGQQQYIEPDAALLAYEAAQSRVTLLASWNLWLCVINLIIFLITTIASGVYPTLVVAIIIIPGIPGAIRHIRWCIIVYWIALFLYFLAGIILAIIAPGAIVGAVFLIIWSGILLGLSIWFFVEIQRRTPAERLVLKGMFKTCCC